MPVPMYKSTYSWYSGFLVGNITFVDINITANTISEIFLDLVTIAMLDTLQG